MNNVICVSTMGYTGGLHINSCCLMSTPLRLPQCITFCMFCSIVCEFIYWENGAWKLCMQSFINIVVHVPFVCVHKPTKQLLLEVQVDTFYQIQISFLDGSVTNGMWDNLGLLFLIVCLFCFNVLFLNRNSKNPFCDPTNVYNIQNVWHLFILKIAYCIFLHFQSILMLL